jgi:hypothetical protein
MSYESLKAEYEKKIQERDSLASEYNKLAEEHSKLYQEMLKARSQGKWDYAESIASRIADIDKEAESKRRELEAKNAELSEALDRLNLKVKANLMGGEWYQKALTELGPEPKTQKYYTRAGHEVSYEEFQIYLSMSDAEKKTYDDAVSLLKSKTSEKAELEKKIAEYERMIRDDRSKGLDKEASLLEKILNELKSKLKEVTDTIAKAETTRRTLLDDAARKAVSTETAKALTAIRQTETQYRYPVSADIRNYFYLLTTEEQSLVQYLNEDEQRSLAYTLGMIEAKKKELADLDAKIYSYKQTVEHLAKIDRIAEAVQYDKIINELEAKEKEIQDSINEHMKLKNQWISIAKERASQEFSRKEEYKYDVETEYYEQITHNLQGYQELFSQYLNRMDKSLDTLVYSLGELAAGLNYLPQVSFNLNQITDTLSKIIPTPQTIASLFTPFFEGLLNVFQNLASWFVKWFFEGQLSPQAPAELVIHGFLSIINTEPVYKFFTEIVKGAARNLVLIASPILDLMNAAVGEAISTAVSTLVPSQEDRLREHFLPTIEALWNAFSYEPPASLDKAMHAANRYLQTVFSLTIGSGLIGVAADSLGNLSVMGTRLGLRGVGRLASGVVFNLGLNWLTWTVFSSLVRTTISDVFELHLKQLYRSRLISVSEAEESLLNGTIDWNDYKDILIANSYTDESIAVLSTNVLVKIVDKMSSLELQIADVEEDIVKLQTITIADLEDKIKDLEGKVESETKPLKEEFQYKKEKLTIDYQRKRAKLIEDLDKAKAPLEARLKAEIEKLEASYSIELEKVRMQKEAEKSYAKLYSLQLKEAELQKELEVKRRYLQAIYEAKIEAEVREIEDKIRDLDAKYEADMKLLELEYQKKIEAKAGKYEASKSRYERQLSYYKDVKLPLLQKKKARLEKILSRLEKASTMSKPEDLIKIIEEETSKKKELVKKVTKEDLEKLKLKLLEAKKE